MTVGGAGHDGRGVTPRAAGVSDRFHDNRLLASGPK